jgi:hypothetical protein
MGQFKPMVKMETTEPSVILKLKKGGRVAGYTPMKSTMSMEECDEKHAMGGSAPKKPSMMERRKSMKAPVLMSKKGGKAEKKAMGGMMGSPAMAAPMAAPVMDPRKAAMLKAMMARKAAMRPAPAMPAAPMAPVMKKGGMAKGGDMSQDKAMVKKAFKQHDMQEHMGGKGTKLKLRNGGTTKVVDGDKTDKAHGTGAIKMGKPAGYAMGGTIEGNEGKYKNTKVVDGDKHDSASGTGGVRMSNSGGFKNGGSTSWENRPADTAKPGKTNTKTGEVRNGNAGGFKMGGAAKKHFATGGSVNTGHAVAMPKPPVSKPVSNTAQSGTFAKGGKVTDWTVLNPSLKQKYNRVNAPVEKEEKPNLRLIKTHTGPKGHVAKTYKDRDYGEYRTKFFTPEGKHLPNSDNHTDALDDAFGTAQSQVNKGYKNGGKVSKFADGGGTDMTGGGYDKFYSDMTDENTKDREAITGLPGRAYSAAKRLLGIKPDAGAGRGYVNPPLVRKSGGNVKC